tara:strand:- start:221 stop:808 length:588 start_codon:yes stop_codon:yes gene_type:complete
MGGHSPSSDSGSADAPNTKKSKVTKVRGEGGLADFIKGGGVVGAVVKGVTNMAKGHNLKRRKEFVSKRNRSLPPSERIDLSDDYLSSAAGKKELTEKYGYNPNPTNNNQGNGNDNNNQQRLEKAAVQPNVDSQMDNTPVKSTLITADKTSPTTAEMSEDQNMIDIKRRGRKTTMLTSDLNENKKTTLSKKVLLGA